MSTDLVAAHAQYEKLFSDVQECPGGVSLCSIPIRSPKSIPGPSPRPLPLPPLYVHDIMG